MSEDFIIEFMVEGTPPSLNNKRSPAYRRWKERVEYAVDNKLEKPHFLIDESVRVTIISFLDTIDSADTDNSIKPTLDGMNRVVYSDDKQVLDIYAIRYPPGRIIDIVDPSELLIDVLGRDRPITYVKVETI